MRVPFALHEVGYAFGELTSTWPNCNYVAAITYRYLFSTCMIYIFKSIYHLKPNCNQLEYYGYAFMLVIN